MSETISFKVQGSELYQVEFINTIDKLKIHCSCPAGQNFTVCKHRKNLISGLADGVVSGNIEQIETVKEWIKSSRFPGLFDFLESLEKDKQHLLKQVSKTKKDIARHMNHG